VLARQPEVFVAVLAAACGYATMNLLMTATPLAMDICGLSFADTALILQWHVIGMFAPSFFTGDLIKRCGVLPVLLAGAALLFACIAIALAGVSLMHFWWALLLLGIGWNFLFVGGTTLLTDACRAEEKAKVQGSNDFIVLGVQGVTSLAAGVLVSDGGWTTLNALALPIVALTTLVSLGLAMSRRRRA
jgi:predicted MFS family arabinose efflux permease